MELTRKVAAALGAVAFVATATVAQAQYAVTNGTVTLGVDPNGSLNVPGATFFGTGGAVPGSYVTGVRYNGTWNEATGDGCPCEGWGAGVAGTGQWMGANASSYGFGTISGSAGAGSGVAGPALYTPVSAVSNVMSYFGLKVTHDFHPSASPNLYEVSVTLTNTTGSTMNGIRYRREMDWDIEPTPFSEYVTIRRGTSTALLFSSDNGFADSNPFNYPWYTCDAGSINADITNSGPCDHGAVFDFGFGDLAAGDSYRFRMFYGAAGTDAAIHTALGLVGAEVYSTATCNFCLGTGAPNTFAWGFAGVGGTVIDTTPEPGSIILLATGLGGLGLGAVRRRRRA